MSAPIAQRVIEILVARCEQTAEPVDEQTQLDTMVDSLTLLEVAFDLEEEFPSVDERAIAAAVSVGDLVRAARVASGLS
jgi:acyl carrier protein